MKKRKNPKALVSVIIPTYNGEMYMQNCLQSVLNQTYKNIEIIVIDDCSKDNTKLYIKSLDNKIIKLFQKRKNSGGPALPRNIGISKAKGKYIAFLDDDDLWEKNKLEICIKKMRNKYDFCYHQLKQKNRKIVKNHNIDITKNPTKFLLDYGPIPTTSAIVVKKETIKKVNGFCESKQIIAGEDYDCWLRMAKMGARFCFINKPLGTYGKSSKRLTNPKRGVKIINEIKKKHFKNEKYIPFWIHKSLLKSICYTKGFHHSIIYGLKNIKNITVSLISLLKKA